MPRVEKQFCKKSYKIEFKLSVLAYWNDSTVDHTLRKFWSEIEGSAAIDSKRKMMYAWKKNMSQVQDVKALASCVKSKLRPTGVACVLPSDIERYLANVIRGYRSEGIPVSNSMVIMKAEYVLL